MEVGRAAVYSGRERGRAFQEAGAPAGRLARPHPLVLPGGRWQGCVLQGSTSAGLHGCRPLQRLGGPRAQATRRVRVPALQLLEH